MPNGEQVAPTHPVEMPSNLPPSPPAHVSWWGEMNRAAKVAGVLTAILLVWTMIGDNFTACIDRSVNEKKESERISVIDAKVTAVEKDLDKETDALKLEQVAVNQKIANFEANFAIQTSEIGNIQADVFEIKGDVKLVQRDMRELLLLMAERSTPP